MAIPNPSSIPTGRYLILRDRKFSLALGEAIIGRGDDCVVKLVSSLVSRHHARVTCDEEQTLIEDLGSRNGTRVNSTFVEVPRPLNHGDRIQIGPYALVFAEDEITSGKSVRRPLLDSTDWADRERVTEVAWVSLGDNTSTASRWPLEMLIELLGKAILAERERDAVGIMKQAMGVVESTLESTGSIGHAQMDPLWEAAVWLSKIQGSSSWVKWARHIYDRLGLPIPSTRHSAPPGAP